MADIFSNQRRLSSRMPLFSRAHVHCESSKKFSTKRADRDNLENVFQKFASVRKDGSLYMTYPDFVQKFLGMYAYENANEDTVRQLGIIADYDKDGLISFEEFETFEGLLCLPDHAYRIAFDLFDVNGNGYVSFSEFKSIITTTTLHRQYPFNFDCDFIDLHFGKARDQIVTYEEFTQLIHDFHEEHALQAFQRSDKRNEGKIRAMDFVNIMVQLKSNLLTPFLRDHLMQVVFGSEHGSHISFSYFNAFISLLNNMELLKKLIQARTGNDVHAPVTREELINDAMSYNQLTPLEVDILFQLAKFLREDDCVSYYDVKRMAPFDEYTGKYLPDTAARRVQDAVETRAEGRGRTFLLSIMEQVYRFALGSIAGAIGATAVYPIDLVKTRMQNQRTSTVGEVLYRNSWDCFKKVIRFEGVFGLYRGLVPQLVGVAPEKAIKLTMNDLVKDQFRDKKTGFVPLWAEILAGGCAGGSQVVFTNPLEIVKIRLQVAGEIATAQRVSAVQVIRDLGFFGLYKGSKACFLRDIPFSAIYFTAYNHLKMKFADNEGYNNPGSLLLAATLSGAPAAGLTTPADVIKTRLQVVARADQTSYNGVFDAFGKILREEGPRAFWKGSLARVFRSSPQFGVTLLTYEMLQRTFYIDFGGSKPSGSNIMKRPEEALPTNPDHIGGYKIATLSFEELESRFGLCLPKYKISPSG